MIHISAIPVEDKSPQKSDWKTLLSASRLTTQTLLERVGLAKHPMASAEAEKLFELRVPQPYIDKIAYGDANDPLLLQVLPQKSEHETQAGYSADPLEEAEFSPVKGLIHKYQSRVLLIANQACAINCRYCFRRSFPYDEHRQAKQDWQQALDYIASDENINEVILSGGDPLTLNNDYLFWLLEQIDALQQIKRIRIHTRLLLVLPQRIDSDFLASLRRLSKKLVMVVHCNHPNELDTFVAEAAESLIREGVSLFNQSVLLKGVNDSAETLATLSEKLFDLGIQPYYLFTLDKVTGASHFDLPLNEARSIYKNLLSRLPGFLVPKLAMELPGETSKTPIDLKHF